MERRAAAEADHQDAPPPVEVVEEARLRFANHPVVEDQADEIGAGEILVVRSIPTRDFQQKFDICRVLRSRGSTFEVRLYSLRANKYLDNGEDAEVEVGAILLRGDILTKKNQLTISARKSIDKQLELEENDRMVTD